MQMKTRRIVSLIAALALTITCAISGLVLPAVAEETEGTTVEPAYTQIDLSKFHYSAAITNGNGEAVAAGDPVPSYTDTDGTEYLWVEPGNNHYTKLAKTTLPTVKSGEWIAITFKTRVHNAGSENTGSLRAQTYVDGFSSDTNARQQEFRLQGANTNWVWVTRYMQASKDRTAATIGFHIDTDNTAKKLGFDIADLRVWKADPDEMNLYGYSADFEQAGIPYSLGYYDGSGPITNYGEFVKEDNGNTAFHFTKAASGRYFVPMPVTASGNVGLGARKGVKLKLSWRQKGGTVTFTTTSNYAGATMSVVGTPTTASNDWETVTTYIDATAATSYNGNYAFNFAFSSGVYFDDLEMYEVTDATAIDLVVNAEMGKGATQTASFTTAKKQAYIDAITYASDNTAVATVDASTGVITGVDYGTANITATATINVADGDPIVLTSTKAVTVMRPAMTGIQLDTTTAELMVGSKLTLTPSISPEGAEVPTYTWESSDTQVATVDNGIVTAVGSGEAVITVKAGAFEATCVITVIDELFPNGDFEGFAEETPVTGPWDDFLKEGTEEAPVVATVKPGVGFNGSYGLEMGSKVTYGCVIFSKKLQLEPNTSYRLSFMATSASVASSVRLSVNSWANCKVYNNSSTSNYVFVTSTHNGWTYYYVDFYTTDAGGSIHDNGGLIIERVKADAADAEAICFDNFSLKKLDKSGELFPGGNPDNGVADKAFAAEFLNGGYASVVDAPTEENPANKAYKFTLSSDKYLKHMPFESGKKYKISFDYKGGAVVLGGKATFIGSKTAASATEWTHFETAIEITSSLSGSDRSSWALSIYRSTTKGVLVDNISITELKEATSITLPNSEMELTVGDTATLTATVEPVGGYVGTLTWSSDNTAAATVENGVITAVGEGTANITVTNGTLSATCAVKVNKLMATEILLNKHAVTLFPGMSETLTTTVLPDGGWHDTLVWASGDETVATVVDGVITAVGPGTTTIGVTAGDLFSTCSVTVLTDLITGGDFEEGRIGTFANVGADSTKTWYIAEGEGFGGGNALAIDYRQSDRLLKWPTFAPNTTYALTFVAKGPQILVNLWKYDGSSTYEIPYTQELDGGWTQYRVEFTTGPEGLSPSTEVTGTGFSYATYGFILNRSKSLTDTTAVTYIDNFSIVQTKSLSGERVIGGDFEVLGPQQWSGTHGTMTSIFERGWNVVTESDGNRALYIPELAAAPGDTWLENLFLKKETEYVISFKAKGAPIDLYFNPNYFAAGGGWAKTAQSDGYTSYAFKVTTKSSVDVNYLINITRETTVGGSEGTYIDDFSVREATADLVAEELVIPGVSGDVKPGAEVLFGVKLTNNGTTAIEGAFPIEYRVNGQVWYTMTYEGVLEAGETKVVLADKAWIAAEGDHSVSVKVNGDLSVADASLRNNTAAKRLRVATSNPTLPSYALNAGFDTLTFADDFDSLDTIDMNATGEPGYKWYVRRPYGGSTVTANDLTIANGILTLKLSDPDYNYGIATIDAKTGAGFSFNKGYLEVRFRIPDSSILGEGERGVPAIWSLPPEKITGKSNAWVEMDWMEYWGKGTKYWRYPKGFYTITMHDQLLNADGTTNHWLRNSNAYQNGLGDTQWHTMGWVWETGKITAYLDGKQVMSQSYSADSKGSPAATVNEGTSKNGVFTGMDTLMQTLILGGSADRPIEVDYVYVWQNVEETEEEPYVFADTAVEGGKIDLGEAGDLFTVQEDATITVNAKPADGYILKPGSLKYVTADGAEVKILNQSLTDMTFGGGDGYTFEFKAPAEAAKITAEFISAENTTFAADTIGTSLRVAEGGGYDGIRFLTRMNLATTFDPEANTLKVKYNGKEYEVVEIGSLLMRYAEGVELTKENAKWTSKAYVKGGAMSLVDYTDSYIDFTVIMTKGANVSAEAFAARKYTARGYIILQDANGNKTTVLCDTQLTNSINNASAAL